jgi:hypothetical protein
MNVLAQATEIAFFDEILILIKFWILRLCPAFRASVPYLRDPAVCRSIPNFLSWYFHSNHILSNPHKHAFTPILCVLPCCWLLHVFRDTWQYFEFRYYNLITVGLYIGNYDKWPVLWASYRLVINTTVPCCLFLFIDMSATNETWAIQIRYDCQTNFLPASRALCSQQIKCAKYGSGLNSQVTLLPIPCALICQYPINR